MDKLSDLVQSFKDLPQTILEGLGNLLSDIFIPDVEDLNNRFKAFLDFVEMRLNIDTDFFVSLLDGEAVVQDVNKEYTIPGVGTFNLKFFDTKYFIDGVIYFRPFIRGVLAFFIILFNIRMALSFIGQDAGFVAGKAISAAKEGSEKEGKQ